MQLDLLFTVNGFIKSDTELFILSNDLIDIDYLCKTIIEIVTLIAKHATLPFIPPYHLTKTGAGVNISKEQVILYLKETLQVSEDSLIRDSLYLLLEDLETP